MKNLKIVLSLIIAMLLVFASIAVIASAEGEDAGDDNSDPAVEDSSGAGDDSSDTGDDSSDTGDDSSDPTPEGYKIKVVIKGDAGSALAYFNDSETAADEFTGTAGNRVSIHIKPAEHYVIKEVYKNNEDMEIDENNECRFSIKAVDDSTDYTITVTTDIKPEPAKLTINASGANTVTVSYNGSDTEYTAPIEDLVTGTEIAVRFDVGGEFNPAKASLTLNGAEQSMASDTFSFRLVSDTVIAFEYDMTAVTFSQTGPSSINVTGYGTIRNASNASNDTTIYVRTGSTLEFTVSAAVNYKIDSVMSGSSLISANESGRYSIIVGGKLLITVKASENASTPVVTSYAVSVSVTGSGKVLAGTQILSGGSSTTLSLDPGAKLDFTVLPDDGYILDIFKVNDEVLKISKNSYSLTVNGDTSVNISFIKEQTTPIESGITASEVDWSVADVVIDVKDETIVLREVFERIELLPMGSFVEFRGNNGSVYVPTGIRFEGGSAYADMKITRITSGATFEGIKTAVQSVSEEEIPFAAFGFEFGLGMPSGTVLKLPAGASLANENTAIRLYDSTNVQLYTKASASGVYKADANGIVNAIPYGGESVIVIMKDNGIEFDETGAVEIALNGGGKAELLTGSGELIQVDETHFRIETTDSEQYTFSFTADEGNAIKSFICDGVTIQSAVGKESFEYTLTAGQTTHSILVEFAEADSITSNSNGKVIAILVIVFVALAGAAALFFVKWKREKY